MPDTHVAPVFVSSDVASQVFDWKMAIRALQDAYSCPVEVSATPARSIAAANGAWLRCLPAVPPASRYFGAKLMAMAALAPDSGVQYVIVLYDRDTSRIAAFVDGEKVTGYRTAATSAAALDRMAPASVRKLAVIGSGLEAQMHTRAFCSIREFSEVVVYSPSPASRQRFAETLAPELGVPVRCAEAPEQAVADADVVLTAARSRCEQPILFGHWIKPGAITVSIGSTVPAQREIDISVVSQAEIVVCDMVHEVVEETGDMLAVSAAGIDVAERCYSINALMSGELDVALAQAKFPLFKSVGGGLQDVVVAGLILDRAREQGLLNALPMEFETKKV